VSQASAPAEPVVVGVDFGTLSGRALVVRLTDGAEPHRYEPVPEHVAAYREMYDEYRTVHDHFGRGANDVMHRLKARRRQAKGRAKR
jgi:ribulose kinase